MSKIIIQGERGFAVYGLHVQHMEKEIGIKETGLRKLTLTFNDGAAMVLVIENTSNSELKLLGELLVKHAEKGTDQSIRVDTEDRIIAETEKPPKPVTYRDYVIEPKRDLQHWWPYRERGVGWVVVYGPTHTYPGANAMPGAAWFRSIDRAKEAIDILEDEPRDKFWDALREKYWGGI